MTVRWCPRAVIVVVLALLLAGCGGDDNAADTDTGATTPTVTAPTTSSTVPATTATTGRAAPQTERERIADCLTAEGYRLQGGAPQSRDTESPEHQIIFTRPRGGGGYIGFYKNQSRAARVAKRVRRTTQRMSGAAVERHGAINIVWIDLPDRAARETVRGCLVT